MLGMLGLEIMVLVLSLFTLNRTFPDDHAGISCLNMFTSVQHEIAVIWIKRTVSGLHHLAFTLPKFGLDCVNFCLYNIRFKKICSLAVTQKLVPNVSKYNSL